MLDHSSPACTLFFCFLFCFEVEISSRTIIPLFMPGPVHSGSASWHDCGRTFLDKLRVSSFSLMGSHIILGIVSPLRLRCVKGVCVFRFHLPPALLAALPGHFTCHYGNTGVERTPNKNQHTKLTQEKKFSRRFCRDSNSQPFDHKSGALTNKLSRLPTYVYMYTTESFLGDNHI